MHSLTLEDCIHNHTSVNTVSNLKISGNLPIINSLLPRVKWKLILETRAKVPRYPRILMVQMYHNKI